MASGRRHWRTRLARLSRAPALPRAGRRQLRKQLGRALGVEWRIFGNTRGGTAVDALNGLIAGKAKALGHVADRLRAHASREGQQ